MIAVMDLRGRVPYTRHTREFTIPLAPSGITDQRYPDKQALRALILNLRKQGMSYLEIGGRLTSTGHRWGKL